jgi:hypothetical protein
MGHSIPHPPSKQPMSTTTTKAKPRRKPRTLSPAKQAEREAKRKLLQSRLKVWGGMDEASRARAIGNGVPKLTGGHYSPLNSWLILCSIPGASVCASHADWEAAGRKVMKGCKGTPIWVPAFRRDGGGEVEGGEDTPTEGTGGTGGRRFVTGHVWDVSQTEPLA